MALSATRDMHVLSLRNGELDALLSADENGGQLLLFDEHDERSVTLPDSFS